MKKILGIGLLLIGLGVGICMLARSGSGFPGDQNFWENESGLSNPNVLGENMDVPPLPGGEDSNTSTHTSSPIPTSTSTLTPAPKNTLTHTPTFTRTPTPTQTLTLTKAPTLTLTLTPTPEYPKTKPVTPTATLAIKKCDWFDQEKMSLILFDIQPGSTDLTLYVKHLSGWPGVEVEDADEWIYTAFLGDIEADKVSFEGYPGRLYIFFKNLPMYMMNTTQELKVVSNLCPLIYTHEQVSIIGPELTPTASEGSSCRSDLGRSECAATGGRYGCGPATCTCYCP